MASFYIHLFPSLLSSMFIFMGDFTALSIQRPYSANEFLVRHTIIPFHSSLPCTLNSWNKHVLNIYYIHLHFYLSYFDKGVNVINIFDVSPINFV
jgi:hypothetical protein